MVLFDTYKDRAILQTRHSVPPTDRAVYTTRIQPEQLADVPYEGL